MAASALTAAAGLRQSRRRHYSIIATNYFLISIIL
jgi:hypothetical protein